jgi:hypothetical protein
MKGRIGVWLLSGALVAIASCSSRDPNWKETFPVTGEVYVDGQPAAMLQVALHDRVGIDKSQPTFSSTFTGNDGRFALSTYEDGDGVPAGEYAITFLWGELNMFSMQYGGPDKLRGQYSDPKKTTFEVKVEPGKPTDLGRIELSTK